jgi:phage-related protein
MWEVLFFENDRGESLVDKFLKAQDTVTVAKFTRIATLLEEHGPFLGMPYTKPLGQGLFEIRILGKKQTRIFYCFLINKKIILLHAFTKKSMAIPKKELRIAKERKEIVEKYNI